jgi:hypothetical protein
LDKEDAMTTFDEEGSQSESKPLPFEAIPQLATGPFVEKATRLRELKGIHDELFRKADEKKGDPGGEFEQLKLEVGAMAMVAGQKSVQFIDLTITNADGGTVQGKLTGAVLIEQYEKNSDVPMPYDKLRAIALSATTCDPAIAVQYGISPSAIEHAREPGKPRSGSVRVEWMRKAKKFGAGRRAGEPVQ